MKNLFNENKFWISVFFKSDKQKKIKNDNKKSEYENYMLFPI